MPNSELIRARAVRDRLLSIIHDAAAVADLNLEVCFNEAPDGTPLFHLMIATRPVPLPTEQSVDEILRAFEDQTELFVHDIQDFDAQLKNVKISDKQTGIYLVQSNQQKLFACTCEAEAEEFVAEHSELQDAELSFVPVALDAIPQTLRQLASQFVEVPEVQTLKRMQTQIA